MNIKESKERLKGKLKRNMRQVLLFLIAAVVVSMVIYHFWPLPQKYYVDDAGRAFFPNRGAIKHSEQMIAEEANYKIYRVIFDSDGNDIYGKLWIPKTTSQHAAIVFLPGAGGTKDAGKDYAALFEGQNLEILALDQRGMGETKQPYKGDFQEEYQEFLKGNKYPEILMVYDALRAYDYLIHRSDVDIGKIAVIGESMGGRNALMAGAIEPGFKLVVGISTGGYDLPSTDHPNVTKFLRSFDPENYVDLISPRKLVMFHSDFDSVQPYEIGLRTYTRSKDPHQFYRVSCKSHGLCDEMKPKLKEEVLFTLK